MSFDNKIEQLRRKAEETLRKLDDKKQLNSEDQVSDIKNLLHELQVHQIELEMQNEEMLKTQTELEAQKNKYTDLFDFAPVGYLIMDTTGLILEANQSFCMMLQFPKSEVVNKNLSQFLNFHSRDSFYFHLQGLNDNESENQVSQLRLRVRNGDETWIKLESKTVFSHKDNTLVIRATISNITRTKKTEEHLLRLSKAFEQSSNSIIITDTEGIIEYVNPRFYEVTGFAPHEVIGQNPRILKYEKSTIDYDRMWQTILSGNTWNGEFLNRTKDGKMFWELATISPVKNNEGQIINFLAIKENITERKIAEEKLQKARDFYLKLLQDFPVMIWQCDQEGEFNYFNQTLCQFTGMSFSELKKIDFSEIIHPKDIRIFTDAFQRSLKSKIPFVVEYRLKDQYSNYRWVLNHARPFTDIDGNYGGFISTCIDIHERNMVEQRLIDSEEKYRRMFEDSSLGIFKLDRNFSFVSANKSFAYMFGYDNTVDFLMDINNQPEAFFPDFNKEKGFIKQLVKSDKERFVIEKELLKKDKSAIQTVIHLRKVNERNSEKDFYMEGFIEDITNRKMVERNLQTSEQKFKALFEKSYDPILILEKDTIIDCNQKACELLGMSRNKLLEKSYLDVSADLQYNGEKSSAVYKNIIKKVRDGDPQNFDWLHLRKGESFDAEVSFARIYVNNKRRIQVIIRDVSEKRLAEKQLKEAKEEAEMARKAQSEFLSLMSHEIRTPLNAVVSLTDLMLHEDLNQDHLENLETVKFSARHLLGLIDDILDYNKIESGNIQFENEDFDLRSLVHELYKSLEVKANEKNIELITHIDENVPNILRTDTLRLKQILYNMLSNALKFTEKGNVSLSIEKNTDDKKDKRIFFGVKDTGIGISENRLDAIFEKFTQAEVDTGRKYGGSGLGLSICKKLVELQGGKIEAKSQQGKGSVFRFFIEMEEGDSNFRHDKTLKKVTEGKTLEGMKILLVEDDKMNQFVGKKVIQNKWKADLRIVGTAEEALDILHKEDFDLILMDLLLPGIDGYQATKTIRKNKDKKFRNASVPIIALTADAFKETRNEAFKAGLDDFITKPFDYPQLFEKIMEYKPQKS
ncbi:MAG: PAS domain S-box protein [Bacteroidota bacterium]